MYVCIYTYVCVCVVYKMYIIQNKTKKIIFLKGDPKKIQNFQSFQDFLPDYINPSKVSKGTII